MVGCSAVTVLLALTIRFAWMATFTNAALASEFAAAQINIDALLQEPSRDKSALPFVVTLEECDPAALARALDRIAAFDFHRQPPLAMPVIGA